MTEQKAIARIDAKFMLRLKANRVVLSHLMRKDLAQAAWNEVKAIARDEANNRTANYPPDLRFMSHTRYVKPHQPT